MNQTEYDLAVVIINYCTPDLVIQCLNSLESQLDDSTQRVVVVDNASPDGSGAMIASHLRLAGWNRWVTLIQSPVNGGFSAGNNLGVRSLNAKLYLLLNSDTIVRPGAISQLTRAAVDHPDAGLIGPRLEWPDTGPQISCFRNHSPFSQMIDAAGTGPLTRTFSRFDVPLPVSQYPMMPDWLSFAAVLVRRQVWQGVGPMDEGYFMFFEDADYCRRCRRAGWKILYWPSARVVHLRGGSSQVKRNQAARRRLPAYYYASRRRYFTRFYGRNGVMAANICWSLGRWIAWMRERVGRKMPHHCQRAFLDTWRSF
ncbi:MAG: glycosyltransferase family 2 protein [Desulfatirhabdiaceae bacterium]